MSKELEKIRLTTKQILLFLVDVTLIGFEPFDARHLYRKNIDDYFNWRDIDKKRFNDDIRRLEREGIIKIYHENDQGVVELARKGKDKVRMIVAKEYKYEYPKIWDQKWRIVIFDIPEKKKYNREIFREKLKEIGFCRLQESVFVFPFDCKEMIDYFRDLLNIKPYVQYVIAETIETQTNLLLYFLEYKVLTKQMI